MITQRDSDAFSVYSFEITENMTFISGMPFQAEAIQEEEESEGGNRKSSNPNIVTVTPATPSRERNISGSNPSLPASTNNHPGSGSLHEQERNSSAGRKSPMSTGRNTPSSGRNTPGSINKTSHHSRNGSMKVRKERAYRKRMLCSSK